MTRPRAIACGLMLAIGFAAIQVPAQGLKLPADAKTVPLGTLAHVEKVGTGPIPAILLTSGGLGWEVWSDFMERNKARYTCYAVVAPGDAGTPSYPLPENPAYTDTPWVNGAADAIIALIKKENLDRPILIGQQQGAAQILTRVALKEPTLVRGIVNIAGTPQWFRGDAKVRETITKTRMVPFYDKVDLETWKSGNWKSAQLSRNKEIGDKLAHDQNDPLNMVAQKTWLLEFGSMNLLEEFPKLTVPILIFDLPPRTLEQIHETNRPFYEKQYGSFDKGVEAMTESYKAQYGSIEKARETMERPVWFLAPITNKLVQVRIKQRTGIYMTKDNPDEIDKEIEAFVKSIKTS